MMINSKMLPLISEKKLADDAGLAYFDPSEYGNIGELISVRRRFGKAAALIEKMGRINNGVFCQSFTNHYYIRAARLNDALAAMLAIYGAIRKKMPYGVGNYIVHGLSPFMMSGIAEQKVAASDSMYWQNIINEAANRAEDGGCGYFSTDDDDFDFDMDDDDDDYDEDGFSSGDNASDIGAEINSAYNPQVIICRSGSDEGVVLDDICAKRSVVFVLNCDDVELPPSPFPFMSRDITKDIKKSDFIYVDIGNEADPALCSDMIKEMFAEAMLSSDGVEQRIKSAAAASDEHSLLQMAKFVIREQLLENSDTVPPSVFEAAVKRYCTADIPFKSSDYNLIGLKKERSSLESVICRIKLKKLRSGGNPAQQGSCSMVFAGPPGTAKTTLARYFTSRLAESGLISGECAFTECRKSDIVGAYVGWTVKKIDELFDKTARSGGVIFFDEIYTLSEKDSTAFDKEAITAITQNMENYRGSVYCIFAGYKDKMEEFLSANPGLRSRIPYMINFGGYDNATLCGIFESICESAGFRLPKGYKKITSGFFEKLRASRGDQFGNGREARNLLDNCERVMSERVLSKCSEPDISEITRFTLEDIRQAADSILSYEDSRGTKRAFPIGFQWR